MSKENLILIGGGGHARACHDVIMEENRYDIIGYLDVKESKDLQLPYLGTDEEIKNYINNCAFLITIGLQPTPENKKRMQLFQMIKGLGGRFATCIAPSAIVSNSAKIEEGTIIMHNCVIQANAKIGENCILNDCSLVEHDVIMGNNCHISTGARVNGGVQIGNDCFIGSSSVIRNNITIGNNVILGQGSNLLKSIGNDCKVYGNPAKLIL